MIRLGREWNHKTGRAGAPVTFDPERDGHFLLLAPPGSGKGVSLEIPNLLLELRDCSVLSIDPSGQNAAVCAEARRRIGNDVLCLNPYGLHVGRYADLQSVGFNPLAGIDPRSPLFLQDCQAVGEALVKIEGHDTHWTQSARGLVTGLIMWEVLKSFRERRAPLLENVRSMLCEPEAKDGDGLLTAGLRFHAAQMIAIGHRQISDLAGRFIKEGSREIDSVISTARTQTEWLLSEPMCSDLRHNGIGDWARLLDRLTTVFVIVPAEFLESQEGSVWLRLVILAALRALYARAGRRQVQTVMFMLSEFAQLGKLTAIETARSQGRKYGVRLWPVLQDIHQLTAPSMYGPHGHESFAGQCGAVFAFAPGDWESAEWMSRRSGEEDVKVPGLSQSEHGETISWSFQRQRRWPPEKILSLPEYHGLVWYHGQSQAVPVYAVPYFDDPECKRLARPDPYHDSGGDDAGLLYGQQASSALPNFTASSGVGQGSGARRQFGKVLVAFAVAVIAGLTLLAFKGHDPVPVDPPKVHHPAVHHPAKHATR
jgi:type IV secretion system protein VirD4